MKKSLAILALSIFLLSALLTSCNKEKGEPGSDGAISGQTGAQTGAETQGTIVVVDPETGETIIQPVYPTDPSGNPVSGSTVSNAVSRPGGGDKVTSSGSGQTTTVKVDDSKDEELVEDFKDWSKSLSQKGTFLFDKSQPALFDDDSSRVIRRAKSASGHEIVYKANPVREFCLSACWGAGAGNDEFEFYLSKDGNKWEKLDMAKVTILRKSMSSGWQRRTYTAYDLGGDYRYFKIFIPNFTSKEAIYSPNLSKLVINKIADKVGAMGGFIKREGQFANGRTIYVDAAGGNNKNDGLSEKSAIKTMYKLGQMSIQAGDKVLFKRGGTYNGQLEILVSGTEKYPITVGSYGSGDRPKIVGKGDCAVNIQSAYVTLSGLDISNPSGSTGIMVITTVSGATKGIAIKDCVIHDVNQNGKAGYNRETAGIYCLSRTGGTKENSVPSWFDGLIIENNTIKNVNRTGIFINNSWGGRGVDHLGFNNYKSDSDGWYPTRNLVIRGNQLDTIGGDGILVMGAKDALIERNVLTRAQSMAKPASVGTWANAGIWPMYSDGTVMQYNEVSYTQLPAGAGDGQAFDIDSYCTNTVVQYNYSHDNEGGFILLCTGRADDKTTGNIVRNNLSVNDGTRNGTIITVAGKFEAAKIYNNTIYMGGGTPSTMRVLHAWSNSTAKATNFQIANNVFYAEGGKNVSFNLENASGMEFDTNVYFNVKQPSGSQVKANRNPKTANPNLVSPGKTGNGLNIGQSYRPKAGSYILTDGIAISGAAAKDYFGAAASGKKYIGAFVS